MVWVRGEHDIATGAHLSATIDRAARLGDVDIIVDLSGVTFMDASTIGVVVAAYSRLRARSRSLSVRAPSPLARRILDVCGLTFLIDEHPTPAPSEATALDSWVAVPATDRAPALTPPLVTPQDASREPALAIAQQRVEPARSIRDRRTRL